jgi:ABC-type nitrate/sulfonate/bicarbonate transport system ATPase subunit
MQQRAQIARVLANDPAVLLMDEPFGALDALTRERLQDELLKIWRGSGRTVLFITHSVEEAAYLGTRVLVMSPRPGRVVLDEPVPFPVEGRDASIRVDPEFVAFRSRIGEHLGVHA